MVQEISQETLLKIQELVEKEGWHIEDINSETRFVPLPSTVRWKERRICLRFFKSEIVTNE